MVSRVEGLNHDIRNLRGVMAAAEKEITKLQVRTASAITSRATTQYSRGCLGGQYAVDIGDCYMSQSKSIRWRPCCSAHFSLCL
jgi:hypothetical protein